MIQYTLYTYIQYDDLSMKIVEYPYAYHSLINGDCSINTIQYMDNYSSCPVTYPHTKLYARDRSLLARLTSNYCSDLWYRSTRTYGRRSV